METGETPRLCPFEPWHLSVMEARDVYSMGEIMESAAALDRSSIAFTAIAGDRVIGSAGVARLWEGTGRVWAVFSEEIHNHKIWIHRWAVKLLEVAIDVQGYRRVETVVRSDSERNCRWIESLGFYRETPKPMKNYRPEGDYYLFARVAE